jgi:hypothetical protein
VAAEPAKGRARFWVRATAMVVARPGLWPTAMRQAGRLAPQGWWRRPPFVPVPRRDYLDYRFETQYGAGGAPEPADVVAYLEWCRALDDLA